METTIGCCRDDNGQRSRLRHVASDGHISRAERQRTAGDLAVAVSNDASGLLADPPMAQALCTPANPVRIRWSERGHYCPLNSVIQQKTFPIPLILQILSNLPAWSVSDEIVDSPLRFLYVEREHQEAVEGL
jgi:hypothetical protein